MALGERYEISVSGRMECLKYSEKTVISDGDGGLTFFVGHPSAVDAASVACGCVIYRA
jgi:hypothetical protein